MEKDQAKQAALSYLARGWSVIPITPRGKRPLVRWQAFQERLPKRAEIAKWFERWPDANLGIVTGAISRLVALDVDPRHGGTESLARLERDNGPLPHTVRVVTGGGGRHVYFRAFERCPRNRVALAPGIDLRGEGGLVVAPPSLHPSGRPYEWVGGHQPHMTSLAPMPLWLITLAEGAPAHPGHPLTHWRHVVQTGVPEGQRNTTIASLAGHLLWHGVDPEVSLELLLCWNQVRCRPPLTDEEVARTVESIRRTHERHRA